MVIVIEPAGAPSETDGNGVDPFTAAEPEADAEAEAEFCLGCRY